MPNVLSPRDLVSRPDNMDKTVPHTRTANFTVSDGIRPKFKLIQAFMVVLVICKNEEDPIKNECAGVLTTFLPLYM